MDSRVSVLIDIRSKLAGLEQATAGFGQLIKTVAGFAAAYLSVRAVVSQSNCVSMQEQFSVFLAKIAGE